MVFDSKEFSLVPASSPATYAGDVWWPANNESFRFYASNVAMTYSATGATVSASSDMDVVCAYQANPIYEATNTLTFKHIFACLSEIKVVSDGHILSDISIWIKDAKTGGTYNLRIGAGHTDSSGWSSLLPVASANTLVYSIDGTIGSGAYDTSFPDLWIVPGDYIFFCTWTAEFGDFSKTYSMMETVPISVVSGKNNKISITLSGGASIPRPIGIFTINSNGDQVGFAPGNLQCTIESGPTNTYNYAGTDWCFATNQWDYLGDTDGANSFTIGKKVDLFGWVGESASYNSYGLCTLTGTNSTYYGAAETEGLYTDWGSIPGVIENCGTGWFTLSRSEFYYLFTNRSTSNTINSTAKARYTLAKIRTDIISGGIKGVILFPDNSFSSSIDGVTWGTINGFSNYGTSCTSAGWDALEAAGCVFLPAAGRRQGTNVYSSSTYGYYYFRWANSPNMGDAFEFSNENMPSPSGYRWNYTGCSVRLVKAVN